jgi:hypothetical protein
MCADISSDSAHFSFAQISFGLRVYGSIRISALVALSPNHPRLDHESSPIVTCPQALRMGSLPSHAAPSKHLYWRFCQRRSRASARTEREVRRRKCRRWQSPDQQYAVRNQADSCSRFTRPGDCATVQDEDIELHGRRSAADLVFS